MAGSSCKVGAQSSRMDADGLRFGRRAVLVLVERTVAPG